MAMVTAMMPDDLGYHDRSWRSNGRDISDGNGGHSDIDHCEHSGTAIRAAAG